MSKRNNQGIIKKFQSCHEIGKLLTSTLDLNEILDHIMLKVGDLVEAENWSLLLLDEKTNQLEFKVVVGIKKELISDITIGLGKGVAGMVAQSGQPIFIEDATNDPRVFRVVDHRTGFSTQSIVCLPLTTHSRIFGVIEIVNIKDMQRFRQEYLPLLEILADYAAIAIENSQYFAKIKKLTYTDEYTGLPNARYMHEHLERLIRKSENSKEKLAVVFMDMDNFKAVVDTYGHLAGSKVLFEVGQVIRANLPNEHLLCKYGGDEFVIIYIDIDLPKAVSYTEYILSAIRASSFLLTENHPVKLTASFGIAIYPDDAKTKKDLLLRADHLMYSVKKSTKNSIAISG